jgi:hypothetical protein
MQLVMPSGVARGQRAGNLESSDETQPMRSRLIACGFTAAVCSAASAQTFDLRTDWSEKSNPNGAWSYRQGSKPLPHVGWWQRSLGGWSAAQPGWARSEDANTRLPFWFRSNGTETFDNDFEPGDIVVHTVDDSNGVGSGPANVAWTCPGYGNVTISGAVWLGRDIGRANSWTLYQNNTPLTSGTISSGDKYDRDHPFDLSTGSNGAAPLVNRRLCGGEEIRLEFVRTGSSGEFVGVNLSVDFICADCPSDWNGSECIDSQDFFDFINDFFTTGADFNNDGVTNSQDFFDFLNAFFSVCE